MYKMVIHEGGVVHGIGTHGLFYTRVKHMKSLFPKPLTSTPDMLLICIIDFLLQLK